MSFKAIVKSADGREAVLTQRQLNLLPNLLRFTKKGKLDEALLAACEKHGCPVDFDAQANSTTGD